MSKTKLMTLIVVLLLGTFVWSAAAQTSTLPENFPPIYTRTLGETGEGYIYLSNFNRARPDDVPEGEWPTYGNYLMVLNNEGTPIFQMPVERRASNFRSYPDGFMIYHDFVDGGYGGGVGTDGPYNLLDSSGALVGSYEMIGYKTALHEFLLLENSHVMMLSYDEVLMDMTEYNGDAEAIVMDVVIQEVDSDNNIVWEWRALDHLSIDDTLRRDQLTIAPPRPVDPIHSNGLAIDLDGNVLISHKHLDEITKINYQTGEVMWRMGGANSTANEFTFIDDPLNGFSAQHSPVILENGNLLLFDNGTAHQPQQSRAVEYELDQEAKTATLVWSYTNGQYARGMGSVQRLKNGNTFIGWGSSSPQGVAASEVDAEGNLVFEVILPETQLSFRAYRLPFHSEMP